LTSNALHRNAVSVALPSRRHGPEQTSRSSKNAIKPITSCQWLAVVLLCLLAGEKAAAGIGETEAEIQAHYGQPVLLVPATVEGSVTKCYLSGGYSVAVTYIDGRSVREMFAKADKSNIGEKEIDKLLKRNAGGATWSEQQLAGEKNVPDGLLGWRTDADEPRVALYDQRTQAFFVTTQRFINQTNAANRREAAKSSRALAGRQDERLLRSHGGIPGVGTHDLPSSSPARKGAPAK